MLKNSSPSKTLLATLVACSLSVTVHAEILGSDSKDVVDAKVNVAALSAPNPYQQFIISLNSESGSDLSRAEIEQTVRRAARFTGYEFRYERPLALGRHLISVKGQLDEHGSKSLMRAIASDPQVAFIEPNIVFSLQFTPNDTRYNEQWNYFDSVAGINLEQAWNFANGSNVRVAVIDTGVTDHPDLNANITGGYDFISDPLSAVDGDGRDPDPSDEGDWRAQGNGDCGIVSGRDSTWHGSHVAGTIAAITNNAEGVAGVAFGAKVVPARAFGKCGGTLADVADAIVWSTGGFVPGVGTNANPARIVNMSLGQGLPCPNFLQSAINDSITARDAFLIASAGNNSTDASIQAPANCFGVFTVAALNRAGDLSDRSNFGSIVDISAPGGQLSGSGNEFGGILSLGNTGTTVPQAPSYTLNAGTSMAAPHVAGVAALLVSADPSMSSSDLATTLTATAQQIPGTCPTNGCGAGLLDAGAALASLGQPPFADQDNDGIPDFADNCLIVANTEQRDTDNDGYGNMCDPDLNNDLVVNLVDLGLLRAVTFSSDPDADFNGDGTVNVQDLGIMRTLFFQPPGPSLVGMPAPPVLGFNNVSNLVDGGVSSDSDGNFNIFWNGVDSAAEYTLRRTTLASESNPQIVVDLPLGSPLATSYAESNLMPLRTYTYEIRVCLENGVCSNFSEPREIAIIPDEIGR